ncbi:N-acetyl sugar amidotransferase [candidate division KSB3 bacterium]|uniref:N-acetyl sugar amidotransferase n=1 Tax=candidate division KSB3 bacterium TaxID=2044937 RepID=A0A9D5JV90_9BACT|nr:N-acetyl sugar amidotransferase [candidate division KSB3 bacterium]MBD3324908.1 N-acetyl sugar amidotransferase [candidate division KSB3 bacterium]
MNKEQSPMERPYQLCTACVMDTTDPDIVFDDQGVCHHCHEAKTMFARLPSTSEEEQARLEAIAHEITTAGQGKDYDCLVGISGGIDSSYIVYVAHTLGLRPLVVHCDNGWNSELAVENIRKLVDACQYDLLTYVIDWEEFKDLQRAFLKASVIDIEMLTDHGIKAAIFRLAQRHRIRYILTGNNIATEFGLPPSWSWNKQDLRNIKAIQKRFGEKKLHSFPTMNTFTFWWYRASRLYKYIPVLNHIRYSKKHALKILHEQFDWTYYGGKHYESLFTKFYQAYILPKKFGIDKRRCHLSSLIRNGEISRDEALAELAKPPYEADELRRDKAYVLKKLEFTEEEFDEIMRQPPKSHREYPSDEQFMNVVESWKHVLKRVIKRPDAPYYS